MNQRPKSASSRHNAKKTPSAPISARTMEERARLRRRRRIEAQRRKKRRLFFGTILAAVIVLAAAAFILISVLTVPEAKKVTIESSSKTQILTFKGKKKKISYQVYRKTPDTEFELVSVIDEGDEHLFVSADLESATLYEYKIIASKGSGEKEKQSKPVLASAYTLPLTITDASAVTLSKDSLTLKWQRLQPVEGFEIKYATAEDFSDEQLLSVTPDQVTSGAADHTLTYTIPSLSLGTTYYFQMRSFCGTDVYSEWSNPFSATVTRAVDISHIDPNKPMIALTYDDGPDNGAYTGRILDALQKVGGHATFFQLGQLCERYPDVAKRIVAEGHQIGCHTYDHTHMGEDVTKEDIQKGNDAIEQICGVRPTAFRATGGSLTDLMSEVCKDEGQSLYQWRLDTRDWSSRDADSVIAEIKNAAKDGTIILMHNIYESTAEASERIIPWLIEQGYQLVTVEQLVQAKTGEPPVAGRVYYTATITDAD